LPDKQQILIQWIKISGKAAYNGGFSDLVKGQPNGRLAALPYIFP
jgi:hypothetical protein